MFHDLKTPKKPEVIRDHFVLCKCPECRDYYLRVSVAEWNRVCFWWVFPLWVGVGLFVVVAVVMVLREI